MNDLNGYKTCCLRGKGQSALRLKRFVGADFFNARSVQGLVRSRHLATRGRGREAVLADQTYHGQEEPYPTFRRLTKEANNISEYFWRWDLVCAVIFRAKRKIRIK